MLDANLLYEEIKKITDESFVDFEGFPKNKFEASKRWSQAVKKYSLGLTPPSNTNDSAALSMETVLMNISSNNGDIVFKNSLTSFATLLAQGMGPTFSGIAPPIEIQLIDVFQLGFTGSSADDVAKKLSTKIDNWFRTGTAINNSSGITINWN